jgi:hypothetical protein
MVVLLLAPMCWAYWLTLVDVRGKPSRWTRAATVTTIAVAASSAWFLLSHSSSFTSAVPLAGVLIVVVVVGLLTFGTHAVARFKLSRIEEKGPEKNEHPSANMWLRNRISRWLSGWLMITVGLAVFALVDSFGQTIYASIKAVGFVDFVTNIKTFPPVAAVVALVVFAESIVKRLDLGSGDTKKWKLPWTLVMSVAAIVVVGVLLSLVGVVSHWVAWEGSAPLKLAAETTAENEAVPAVVGAISMAPGTGHAGSVDAASPVVGGISAAHCFGGLAICAALTVLLGRPEYFLNLSSHVTLYSARLARAYLGASNPARMFDPKWRRLTDVHKDDTINMERYRPFNRGGPLHLINLTLNETVSGSSQIEHRDRKGMSLAVGPAGMSVGTEHHGLWGSNDHDNGIDTGGISPIVQPGDLYHPLAQTDSNDCKLDLGSQDIQRRRLEQWIAASGAAFTTGLGWRTSLGASMLMALGNVRLGHWWDSHIDPGNRRIDPTKVPIEEQCRRGSPMPPALPSWLVRTFTWLLPVHSYLLEEATARFFGPQKRYWYLSDGGHFENTACYELIRRRVPLIICCDCGADPGYDFADLANLVRKARTDFGVEIVFHDEEVCTKMLETIASCSSDCLGLLKDLVDQAGTKDPGSGSIDIGPPSIHSAIGFVYYPETDSDGNTVHPRPGETEPGSVLIILKPSVTGDEPLDVQRYGRANPTFPQETTGDQFFDEAQWESYRKLGVHIADKVLTPGLFEIAEEVK